MTDSARPSVARKGLATVAGFATTALAASPFVCCFGSCLGNFGYMVSAPPLARTVALIESSPVVRDALGGDVDVSLVVTRDLERDFLRRNGRDRVFLITIVDGGRGEAMLTLDAVNVDDQGWAGRFTLDRQGHQVLRDGAYVVEEGGTILAGTFLPDGTPVVGGH